MEEVHVGQFQLDVDRYVDNNHFIRINHIKTDDDRWNPIRKERKFSFNDLDLVKETAYISKQYVING